MKDFFYHQYQTYVDHISKDLNNQDENTSTLTSIATVETIQLPPTTIVHDFAYQTVIHNSNPCTDDSDDYAGQTLIHVP